jgi:hypothetical protein
MSGRPAAVRRAAPPGAGYFFRLGVGLTTSVSV